MPQNGGRLMQVVFAGHPYLFVNPKYEGKYLPPSSGEWFNYGGDKIWLLPEGNDDEQHWAGGSDAIDDSPFSFRKVSEGQQCEIELTGPADPRTGVQFVRTIRLEADSPRIYFRANMKNITGHNLEWSMQSVSQYDTGAPGQPRTGAPSGINHDFRTFTPANPASSYLNRYHVRFGPAENRAASIRDDGLFTLRYVHMAAELWLDSTAGWLAVVDGTSRYGMVERFQFDESRPYPGKASIIFWTNGPAVKLSADGMASMPADDDSSPYYLEAEVNSPSVPAAPRRKLQPRHGMVSHPRGQRISRRDRSRPGSQPASRQPSGEWQAQAFWFVWSVLRGKAGRPFLRRTWCKSGKRTRGKCRSG